MFSLSSTTNVVCFFYPSISAAVKMQLLNRLSVVYFNQRFCAKKPKKSKKFAAKFCKKHIFKFAPERWPTVLFPKKWAFFLKNTFLHHFWGNKTVDQHSGANLNKHVFCNFLLQISCFFLLFNTKNAENDYFDQRLECAAPKCWSKYTTAVFKYI